MLNRNLPLDTFTVSFFGHRIIEDPLQIEQHIETLIRKLLKEKEYVEFLVGSGGAWQTMKYAKKQGKPCININDDPMEEAL